MNIKSRKTPSGNAHLRKMGCFFGCLIWSPAALRQKNLRIFLNGIYSLRLRDGSGFRGFSGDPGNVGLGKSNRWPWGKVMVTRRIMKIYKPSQASGFVDALIKGRDASAKGAKQWQNDVETRWTAGADYAGSACHSVAAVALLAAQRAGSQIHEWSYQNHPPIDPGKQTHWQKSKIQAWIEQVLWYLSQSMQGFSLRSIGDQRNEVAIGLINLVYSLAHDEQIVREQFLSPSAA